MQRLQFVKKSGSGLRVVTFAGAESRAPCAQGGEVSRMMTKNNYASLSQPNNIPIPILFLGDKGNVYESPPPV